MITSYLLAQTFVPVLANWIMKGHGKKEGDSRDEYKNYVVDASTEADTWDQKKLLLEGGHGRSGKLTRFEKFRARYLRF